MRPSLALNCSALVLCLVALRGSTGAPTRGASEPVPHWLVRLAHRTALLNGDAHPTSVAYDVQGNRAVVTIRGDFVCNTCSRPSRAKAPTGTVITLVVDMKSRVISSFGLTR